MGVGVRGELGQSEIQPQRLTSQDQSEGKMSIESAWRGLVALGAVITLVGAGGCVARQADRDALRPVGGADLNGADVNAPEGDGTTALMWASHRNDLESVERLIRAGADVNAANDLGATALWAASQNGSAEVVEMLLAAGADPNKALRHGETPLMVASRSGNPAVVEMLLAHGADLNATGPRDQTALMWAAGQRHSDVVAVLIEGGADVHARSAVWRLLMAQPPHPHPQHRGWFEHGGNTALMFAARVGDVASAQHLVAAGADVNDRSAWGVSVLTMAAYSNFGTLIVQLRGGEAPLYIGGHEVYRPGEFVEFVELLLENGADPDLGAGRFTALHAAIMRRDEKTVDLLLEHGANPNLSLAAWTPQERGSRDFSFHRAWVGASPVWLAARFGTPYILRRLVEHGGDPGYMHRGEHYAGGLGGEFSDLRAEVASPLMAAVGMSRTGDAWVLQRPDSDEHEAEVLEKVKLLVESGVDVNAVNHQGLTALDGAKDVRIGPSRGSYRRPDVETEYVSVVEFLSEAGAEEGTGLPPPG